MTEGKLEYATPMSCLQNDFGLKELCVPDMDSRTNVDLARSDQSLERMTSEARNFLLMALVELLLVFCRVVEDGEA